MNVILKTCRECGNTPKLEVDWKYTDSAQVRCYCGVSGRKYSPNRQAAAVSSWNVMMERIRRGE